MVNIFEQIFSELCHAINQWSITPTGQSLLGGRTIQVKNVYTQSQSNFPYITIEEKINTELNTTLSGNEKYSRLMYEVNIYDNNDSTKIKLCFTLAGVVNEYFSGWKRVNNEPIPNTANSQIYRIQQRYQCGIDNDELVIYKSI